MRNSDGDYDLIPYYKDWYGSNKFFFNGRCITGNNLGMFIGTLSMITIPMFIFFVFGVP